MRATDFSGKKQDAALALYGNEYNILLGANEIKTLKLNGGVLTEVNMLEEQEITQK